MNTLVEVIIIWKEVVANDEGLVLYRGNFGGLAMELLQSCIKPSMYFYF